MGDILGREALGTKTMSDFDGNAAMARGTMMAKAGGGTGAIAGVRGDVTTVRAAEAIRARRTAAVRPERLPVSIEARGSFPLRLLDVGPV